MSVASRPFPSRSKKSPPSIPSERVGESVKQVRPALKTQTRLLLLPFRSGEAVTEHPDLSEFLKEGWRIQSASPRVTREGTRLFVVLNRNGSPSSY